MKDIEKLFTRRSIRKFKDEPVSEEIVNKILEAGRLSPSATNSQPWHFIIVRNDDGKDACTFGGFNKFALNSDFIVVGIYRKSEAMMEQYSLMDVTIALQSMVIAAWLQGIGSCWMGAFDVNKLSNTLNLPSDARIVGAIAFGKPDEVPVQPKKKQFSEIFHYDQW